jgi:hypothetical protein
VSFGTGMGLGLGFIIIIKIFDILNTLSDDIAYY